MKLADLIDHLIELQNIYGNLDVYHHDCEWGLSDTSPGLSKVITENGSLVHFDAEVDRNEPICSVADYEAAWDLGSDGFRGLCESREAYLEQCQKNEDARSDLLRRIREAPYSIVF